MPQHSLNLQGINLDKSYHSVSGFRPVLLGVRHGWLVDFLFLFLSIARFGLVDIFLGYVTFKHNTSLLECASARARSKRGVGAVQ